jgi:hypothetical protein
MTTRYNNLWRRIFPHPWYSVSVGRLELTFFPRAWEVASERNLLDGWRVSFGPFELFWG